MKSSSILIIILWIVFWADAFRQGIMLPNSPVIHAPFFENISIVLLIFPFLFFLFAPLSQRNKAIPVPFLPKIIDSRYGVGAFDKFITRFRPTIFFMVYCLILGSSGLISTYLDTRDYAAYSISGMFISSGLGLLVAYFWSVKFPPKLI